MSAVISASLLLLSSWAAFLFIKESIGDTFSSFVGVLPYQVSAFSVLRVSQDDMTFAVALVLPLGLLALRRVRLTRSWRSFIALTIVLVILFYFKFLQKVAYAGPVLGC